MNIIKSTHKNKVLSILRESFNNNGAMIFEHTLECDECAKLLEEIVDHWYKSQREYG